MTTLTIMEAARVTGVSRSQLYRYIRSGKLSRTPDGLLDTTELLRAGLPLRVSPVPSTVPFRVSEAHDATNPDVAPVPEPVPRVPPPDTATLERLIDVLQRELDAARERETLLTQRLHERETQLTQMAHERETQLLHLVAQMHQQNQRLLDMPRPRPQDAPGRVQAPRRTQGDARYPDAPTGQPGASLVGSRSGMRQRIVALLRDYPEGLTPGEMQARLGVARSLTDTCQGMLRYGLLRRLERGRYVVTTPSPHEP